uniref:xanthine dehydrogenase/oxidase-like n=1 Tax=Myxine glutinosa TaxID=7769 RepID=UPI00358FD296
MDYQGTSNDFFFYVNGTKIVDQNVDPETTLLSYLRNKLGLTGAKLACGEGGCGACTVMVSHCDPGSQHIRHYAVNTCLTPICSLHGKAVITTEGIGNSTSRLHPVQERIIKFNGSQCGFCTPGFVMSMYSLLRNSPAPNQQELSEAFQGNLCRCTGYRGIIEGYQTFVKNSCCGRNDGAKAGKCCDNLSHAKTTCGSSRCCRDSTPEPASLSTEHIHTCRPFCKVKPLDPTQEPIFPPELLALANSPPVPLDFQGPRVRWLRPVTLTHLLQLKNQFPDARLVVGNTEVGVEIKFKNKLYPVILEPSYIQEMCVMHWDDSGLHIGASCRIAQVKAELQDAVPKLKRCQAAPFVALMEQLRWFAGSQIRNVAAIGGNIMTASPLSDLNPLLLASRTSLTFSSIDGSRTLQMTQDFFTSYRSTATKDNEVLISIHIPYSRELEFLMAFKQGQRREDDMAIVNAAMRARFCLETSRVTELEMAFGGMGNRTLTAARTTSLLNGKLWNSDLLEDATNSLLQEIQLPGGSPGGMETYRCSLCLSFLFKFYLHVQMELQNQVLCLHSLLQGFQRNSLPSTVWWSVDGEADILLCDLRSRERTYDAQSMLLMFIKSKITYLHLRLSQGASYFMTEGKNATNRK